MYSSVPIAKTVQNPVVSARIGPIRQFPNKTALFIKSAVRFRFPAYAQKMCVPVPVSV